MLNIYTLYNLLYENYEVCLYQLQHNIYTLLSLQINQFTPIIVLLIFLVGVLTSLTPCFISILPLSISYINTHKKYSINKTIFLVGLVNSLLLILFLENSISYKYSIYINSIPLISSFILILISLNLLQIFDFSSLSYFFTYNFEKNFFNNIYWQSYLAGSLLAFNIVPCSTSITFIFIYWLSHCTSLILFILYWLIYILGCIFPFIFIFTTGISYLNYNYFQYIWNTMIPISGSLVLFSSLLSFLEKIYL